MKFDRVIGFINFLLPLNSAVPHISAINGMVSFILWPSHSAAHQKSCFLCVARGLRSGIIIDPLPYSTISFFYDQSFCKILGKKSKL